MKRSYRAVWLIFFTAVALTFGADAGIAATRTWTGRTNDAVCAPFDEINAWSMPCNWSGKVVPSAGDNLVFGASPQPTSDNTFTAGTTIGAITISRGHTVDGNRIALTGGITGSDGTINLDSITLNGDQSFTAPTSTLPLLVHSAISTSGNSLTLGGAGLITMHGVIVGTGRILVSGTGRKVLTANNTYTGSTQIEAGTLIINGSQPSSDILVTGTSTLGGKGVVRAIESVLAQDAQPFVISPGVDGPGSFSVENGLLFGNAGPWMLEIDLNGQVAGLGYDRLAVGSIVELGDNAQLEVTLGGSFIPSPGDTFIVIDNVGFQEVFGQFQGLPDGASFVIGNTTFVIGYHGGDGNDVVLHVPTTRTWDGGGADANWRTAANWVEDIAPEIGDSLDFPSTFLGKTNVNDFPDVIPSGTTFGTIRITTGAYDISGSAIRLTTGLVVDSSSSAATNLRLRLDGPGGLTCANEGAVLVLSENNNYTGPTLINDGSLTVNGTQPASPVTLVAGSLSGGGRVGPLNATGGRLRPGSASAPALRVTGHLNLGAGVNYEPVLSSTGPRLIRVTGSVSVGDARLDASFAAAQAPAMDSVIIIVENDLTDPVIGKFDKKPEGTVFAVGLGFFRISYTGGDGNDVTLTRIAPPTFSVGDVVLAEGNSGVTQANFTATLSYPVEDFIRCSARTSDQTAAGGSDYVPTSFEKAGFAGGTTSNSFSVPVIGDLDPEANETFALRMTCEVAAAGDNEGTATIVNDDAASTPTPSVTPIPTSTPIPTPTPNPTATPTATPAFNPTALGNIATRLRVETGNNVLIGGFIITGEQPKKLMLRAIGPSLPISDVLANPQLELFDSAGELVASNDNWQEAPNRQEIIESTIAPANDLESAILGSFAPGAYTAVVSGVGGGTGVGVVEGYDLDRSVNSKLANIATRGVVRTENNVMIGGLIVLGDAAQNVLVRAIGPSLPIDGKLADPLLQLFDGDGNLLQSNDNWRSDQEGEITATTIPPTDELESAIVGTLPPGAYTAVVRGVGGTTGVALVEVYALD